MTMIQTASGHKITCTPAGTCPTPLDIKQFTSYEITAEDGQIYFGVEDCDSDDTKVLWTIPTGVTRVITTPGGSTKLYFYSATNNVVGRVSKVID